MPRERERDMLWSWHCELAWKRGTGWCVRQFGLQNEYNIVVHDLSHRLDRNIKGLHWLLLTQCSKYKLLNLDPQNFA
jgi:hypothetical protein